MRSFYIITALTALVFTSPALSQQCNGHSELCSRPYHQVAFPGTHNSFSAVKNNPAANQFFPVATQLNDENAGTAVDTLKIIADFMKANPNEVITIIWENYDKIDVNSYAAAYQQAGLDKFAYTQPSGQQQWPTLSELISKGTTLINFIDNGASPSVPWLHDEFTYVIDTPFSNNDPNNWQCVVDRPPGASPSSISLYNVNHFLYGNLGESNIETPQPGSASSTNGPNLEQHAQQCTKAFGRIPNFVSVDFYDQGSNNVNIFSVVAELNNVTYTPKPLGDTSYNGNQTTTANASLQKGSGLYMMTSGLLFVALVMVGL
ncbi:5697_t:CDS:2 [Paraglomus occultum]|uniref:5697_t:CDS:1 n=1 Tax=Paraglomus occultum TaxID=144539 RepID=A0A9N8ZW94_9GLOM|nr:5697_t:CDS:2 [Paraglomus occultum]